MAPPRPNPPSQPSADRDLLFGIVALQMDFIARDDLVAAIHAWVAEKTTPLAEVLVARGALDASDRALLEPMVQRHVARHGGDPARSLAALSGASSARAALAPFADPDVQTSVALLAPSADEPPLSDPTATFVHEPAPPGGTRFRVLRPHARGGLGEVYVARDEELGRQVALKEIQRDKAGNPDLRARFVLEAEINGNLEHPGIVPVYGLGTYPDGRPYYAMRFIRGDSLKQAIASYHAGEARLASADRALRLRQLLRRFLDVCNAIDYAHSRGVLHRDLKPANVMLGRYGETLVVDWGLAKATGRRDAGPAEGGGDATLVPPSGGSHDPTLAGSALGTPQYMSPEQAEGRLDRLGPATDVYGLGATLYCLLTGRAPVTGSDLDEVLARVCRGDIPPPRRVNPDVPRALEAVCLKALARRPEDRYGSPRALADDLERWLADEPVSVYRDRAAVRLGRWARRHRPLVAGAAAVVATALAALAVSTVLLARKQAETDAARLQAEAGFRQAQEAVERYLTRVSQTTLLKAPGLQKLRRELLETAREFHARFVRERGHDPRVRGQLGVAYLGLAKVEHELGERARALDLTRKAVALFEDLLRDPGRLDPGERDRATRNLAACLGNQGQILRVLGQPADAEAAYRRAVPVAERLVRDHPGEAELARVLTALLVGQGQVYQALAGRARAGAALARSVEVSERLARDRPDDPKSRATLAASRGYLGAFHESAGDLARARDLLEQAAADWEALETQDPRDPEYPNARANTLLYLVRIDYNLSRFDRAEAEQRAGVAIRERLARENPAVTDYQYDLAVAYAQLASILAARDRGDEAEEVHRKALPLWERLVRDQPGEVAPRHGLAFEAYALGAMLDDLGRSAEAAQALRTAQPVAAGLARDVPTNPNYRELAASVDLVLARALAAGGRAGPAEEALRRGLAASDAVFRADPDNPRHAPIRYERAVALLRLGHGDDALAESDRALKGTLTTTNRYDLARAFARAAPAAGPGAAAERLAARALAILEGLQSAGYFRDPAAAAAFRNDPDFQALRGRGDFDRFAAGLATPP